MANGHSTPLSPSMFALFAALFLLFWSTGFVAAKFGLPYAEPLTFLGTRFVIASALMLLLCLVMGASWPRRLRDFGHIITAGLLVQCGYLIGVYYGIYLGVSIGIMALIVGLQPLITSVLVGPFLGESVSPRQRLGLVLGFSGLGLVVAEKVVYGVAVWFGYLLGLVALVAITAGTLYQKKFCAGFDLRSTVAIQNCVSCVLILVLAVLFETMEVSWTGEYLFALIWSSVCLSVIAIMAFYYLVARGAATKVTSLLYLSPPTTAVMGWLFFGETLAAVAITGMVISVVGVALVSAERR
jgi:drug/metabolite transporter (DMT)-like permease